MKKRYAWIDKKDGSRIYSDDYWLMYGCISFNDVIKHFDIEMTVEEYVLEYTTKHDTQYEKSNNPYMLFFDKKLEEETVEETIDRLLTYIEYLDLFEQFIIRLRFGLLGKAPMSYRNIAQLIKIDEDEVRIIEKQALLRLKEWLVFGYYQHWYSEKDEVLPDSLDIKTSLKNNSRDFIIQRQRLSILLLLSMNRPLSPSYFFPWLTW